VDLPIAPAGPHAETAVMTIHWRYAARSVSVTAFDRSQVLFEILSASDSDSDFLQIEVPFVAEAHTLQLDFTEPRDLYNGQPLFGIFEIEIRST
jgi:hypothetical protein